MRNVLPNLLTGAFGVLGSAASVASLGACTGPAIPAMFVTGAVLSLVYQCVRDRLDKQEAEEKLDALLYIQALEHSDLVALVEVAGLGTDANASNENGLTLLYQALSKEIREAAIDPQELETRLTQLFAGEGDKLAHRLSARLLDQTSGLQRLLTEHNADLGRQFGQLAQEMQRTQETLATLLEQSHRAPRLSLNLEAYGEDSTAFERLNYRSRRVTLVGRDNDLDFLHGFLAPEAGADGDFRWQLLTGPAGMGKSRLGLELCLQAIERGFDAGFWDRKDPFEDWDKWTVDRPTLVVIDYVAERAEAVRDGIDRLYRYRERIQAPLRLLLLERTADEETDNWYRDFMSRSSTGTRTTLLKSRYHETRPLAGLTDDDDLRAVFAEIFAEQGFSVPAGFDLASLYHEIDPEGRPLLVASAAEVIGLAGDLEKVRQWSKDDLVREIVGREVERWRDAGIDERHANLLLYATLTGGCDYDTAQSLHEQGLPVPPPDDVKTDWLTRMTSFGTGEPNDGVPPLAPDLLGEWLLLERLAGRQTIAAGNGRAVRRDTEAVLLAAWGKDPHANSSLLGACGH